MRNCEYQRHLDPKSAWPEQVEWASATIAFAMMKHSLFDWSVWHRWISLHRHSYHRSPSSNWRLMCLQLSCPSVVPGFSFHRDESSCNGCHSLWCIWWCLWNRWPTEISNSKRLYFFSGMACIHGHNAIEKIFRQTNKSWFITVYLKHQFFLTSLRCVHFNCHVAHLFLHHTPLVHTFEHFLHCNGKWCSHKCLTNAALSTLSTRFNVTAGKPLQRTQLSIWYSIGISTSGWSFSSCFSRHTAQQRTCWHTTHLTFIPSIKS